MVFAIWDIVNVYSNFYYIIVLDTFVSILLGKYHKVNLNIQEIIHWIYQIKRWGQGMND